MQQVQLSALKVAVTERVNLEAEDAGLSRNHFSDEFRSELSRAEENKEMIRYIKNAGNTLKCGSTEIY